MKGRKYMAKLSSIKALLPWWVKIIIKIVLSRMPVRYSFWSKLGLYRHGDMDSVRYAYNVFMKHYNNSRIKGISNFALCEVGPGDSPFSACFAYMYGAKKSYLVDAGFYIDINKALPEELNDVVEERVRDLPFDIRAATQMDMLRAVNGHYLSDGIDSYLTIQDDSVDFLFSNAVLEHIRLKEFDDTIQQTFRIMKPGGVCTHTVDLRDHLQNGLNNLRFSRKVWESKIFTKSGFYTNRLRCFQIINSIKRAGFLVKSITPTYFPQMPIKISKLNEEFSTIPEDELLIESFDIVLEKP